MHFRCCRCAPQLRALLFVAIGAGVIIHNKNLNGKPHFKTLHGKVSSRPSAGPRAAPRLQCRSRGVSRTASESNRPACSPRRLTVYPPPAPAAPRAVTRGARVPAPTPLPTAAAPQLGLLTLVLTGLSPVLGAVSFRKLGIIQRFPDHWQPRLKKLHKLVSMRLGGRATCACFSLWPPHAANHANGTLARWHAPAT